MPDLSRLLRPASVAYVGGSQIAGPIRAARRAGYEGDMYVINPVKDQIEGIPCTKSAANLPVTPDAAVIGLSPERAIIAVKKLSDSGCGGAVVMSSGFSELNTDEGRERQQRLVEAAGSMPLLGPNCMGLMNQFSGAFVWGDDNHCERQSGPAAAIISQSGALLIGMTGVEKALPLGYAISIGNQAVTTAADLVDAIAKDDRIKAIGLYLEGMNEGEPLGRACLDALKKGVPVIALKGGDQAAGAAVAQSHTASMVVERDLWDAFKSRFGIEEVSSPKALIETLKLLTVAGLPKGNKVSIVSYSGGINGLAATRCAPMGIALPHPSEANDQWLRQNLPETVAIANPIDLNIPYSASDGSISMRDTTGVAEAIVKFAENVSDQITFFIDVPRPGAGELDRVWCDSLEALIEVRNKLGLPVSVSGILPEGLPEEFRRHMHANGVATVLGFTETMEAISLSIKLADNLRNKAASSAPAPLLNVPQLDQIRMLDEAASKSALAEFGLIAPVHEAVEIEKAVEAAERIGFPVALKVLSTEIAHKAKLGGVRLNLKTPDELTAAANKMASDVETARAGHAVKHVLVEKMLTDADTEMIVGIKRHPALGLAMMVGRGGSKAEELSSFQTILLPLQTNDLAQAFCKLGIHNHPAIEGFETCCKAVAAYALANTDTLITLDVNPVMLGANGSAVATDALIVLGEHHDTA
ncbi:MAG: acetate--CoA ligase family protein [Pseudomonadota bacterium]